MLIHKISFITCLLISLTTLSFSQSGWFETSFNNWREVADLYFVNSNTGIAVGYWGLISRTTNAGLSWTNQIYDSLSHYYCIHFVNNLTGFIGSDYGNILKTTDRGMTWNIHIVDSLYGVYSICFVNINTGFAVGAYGKIAKTTNCGENWVASTITNQGNYLRSIFFIGNDTGFTAGGPTTRILKTTNSGENWTEHNINDSINVIYSIFFTNSSTGFISGRRKVFKTTNSGLNWRESYYIPIYYLMSTFFVSENIGYVVGGISSVSGEYLILKTSNAGINWITQLSGSGFLFNAVRFTDYNIGYTVGGNTSNNNGRIFKTTNGGEPIGIKPINKKIPNSFSLSQNYPNPFNPATKIKFDIPAPLSFGEGQGVRLLIYDALGREVTSLVNEGLSSGSYEVNFDGSNYPSGVYFYKLMTADYSETKKMVLLK